MVLWGEVIYGIKSFMFLVYTFVQQECDPCNIIPLLKHSTKQRKLAKSDLSLLVQ